MKVASTILVAREDFSIPGADPSATEPAERATDQRQHFFDLLQRSRADVVVLNLTVTEGRGVAAIRQVRQQSSVPILVVCASADPLAPDYRSAGANDCLHPPVDVSLFNQSIRNVVGQTPANPAARARPGEGYRFQGITYQPDQASLAGPTGTLVPLEPVENAVFGYLAAHSWVVCSRAQLAESAYRDSSVTTQRSVGEVLSRLRKKLELAGGPGAGKLLKTQPRRGYTLVADMDVLPLPQSDGANARR